MVKICFERNLEAYVLPSGIDWPIMFDKKQSDVLGKRALFHRNDNASIGRELETWSALLEDEAVVWTGLPGIGKSLSGMFMFMEAIQKMKANIDANTPINKEWFQRVFYRYEEDLYEFIYEKDMGFTVLTHDAGSTLETARIMHNQRLQELEHTGLKSLLIVEMEEKEIDPTFNGAVLVCPSARRVAEKTCKTYYKAHQPFFVLDPPSRDVLLKEYEVLQQLEEKLPDHISTTEKFKELIDIVGPVPRYLFSSKYQAIQSYLNARSIAVSSALGELDKTVISYSDVGEYVKYFMAPYIRPGVRSPRIGNTYADTAKEYLSERSEQEQKEAQRKTDIYEFRFLTESCKVMLASQTKSPTTLHFWRELGRPHELLEATVKCARNYRDKESFNDLAELVPERSRIENWLWYNDKGSSRLTEQDRIENVKEDLTRQWKEIVKFDGTIFNHNVWELEEYKLYESILYNLALAEYWFVNHRMKRVYGDQVTLSLLDHEFNIETINKALESFGMLKGRGLEYKLVLIGINDMSKANPTGLMFSMKQVDMKTGTRKISMSLKEWQKQLQDYNNNNSSNTTMVWEHADRVETYIARVSVFNEAPFILNSASTQIKREQVKKEQVKSKPVRRQKKTSDQESA